MFRKYGLQNIVTWNAPFNVKRHPSSILWKSHAGNTESRTICLQHWEADSTLRLRSPKDEYADTTAFQSCHFNVSTFVGMFVLIIFVILSFLHFCAFWHFGKLRHVDNLNRLSNSICWQCSRLFNFYMFLNLTCSICLTCLQCWHADVF